MHHHIYSDLNLDVVDADPDLTYYPIHELEFESKDVGFSLEYRYGEHNQISPIYTVFKDDWTHVLQLLCELLKWEIIMEHLTNSSNSF